MEPTGYDHPMVFILTVDRNIFFWVVAITFFFAISVVAVVSKGRKWYELIAMFFLVYLLSLLLASTLFSHLIHLPFAQLETVSLP